MTSTVELVLKRVQSTHPQSGNKITVVGAGQVGMACAFSILTQRISNELCLIDCVEDKLRGEIMDLEHGSVFLSNCKVSASTEYAITAGSKLCIVAAGVRKCDGDTPSEIIDKNTQIMKNIVPELVEYSPNTILLIVTNPVDTLTYVAWKLSGLPKERVIGSGTNLDSSRFRFLLSQKLGVAPTSCQGWIIGEHGESSIAVWSGVTLAGVSLSDLQPTFGDDDDPENWQSLHRQIIESTAKVRRLKGYTSWGVGMSVADIAQSILYNLGVVHAVSILARGYHDIEQEVYLSLPAILGANGVTDIVMQPLSEKEQESLHKCATILAEVQNKIEI